MKRNGPFPGPYKSGKRYVVLAIPTGFPRLLKNVGLITAIIAVTNMWTYRWAMKGRNLPVETELWASTQGSITPAMHAGEQLYLLDKASKFLHDPSQFATKVKDVSGKLEIPAEWLMAVMYIESKFDASVYNYKGSGAVGLIQFMPSTARDLNTSAWAISKMNHLQQLEYVYMYLDKVKNRHGPYKSLADLYLGILYPKARSQEACYTLFAKPSRAYRQNSGLDEDRDGRVTVMDIEKRLARLFPTAYAIDKAGKKVEWSL